MKVPSAAMVTLPPPVVANVPAVAARGDDALAGVCRVERSRRERAGGVAGDGDGRAGDGQGVARRTEAAVRVEGLDGDREGADLVGRAREMTRAGDEADAGR